MIAVKMVSIVAQKKKQGLRPFDPARDMAAVADLLEVAFREELGPESRGFLNEMRVAGYFGPALWILAPLAGFSGYVWEEEGRVVGNLTLSHFWEEGYLISNVAVHPNFRRRGIARRLTEAALTSLAEKGGSLATLEVRRNNLAAKSLYKSLGFVSLTTTAQMRLERYQRQNWVGDEPRVVELRGKDKARVEALSRAGLNTLALRVLGKTGSDLGFSVGGTLPSLLNRLLLVPEIRWWGVEENKELMAVLVLNSSRFGPTHRLELVVHPEARGRVERALLQPALESVSRFSQKPILAKIYRSHPQTEAVLAEHGFLEVEVLERMGVELEIKRR